MKLTSLLLALALGLLLAACAGLTTKQTVAVSCTSAAAALDTLTAAKTADKITAAQLTDAIAIYKRAVIPVCVPVAENLDAVKRAALAAALAELTARAGGVP